jgi:hypothetical protein
MQDERVIMKYHGSYEHTAGSFHRQSGKDVNSEKCVVKELELLEIDLTK